MNDFANTRTVARALCATVLAFAAAAALAQTDAQRPSQLPKSGRFDAVLEANGDNPVPRNETALGSLVPDKQCKRADESMNVWEQVSTYGGKHAELRMQRILSSNFQYTDLTQQDKDMLRYLAYTTVWVPESLENAVGSLYTTMTRSGGGNMSPLEQGQLDRLKEQVKTFKSVMSGYSSDVAVLVDSSGPLGASASVGGFVRISPEFLNMLDEKDAVRRLVVAHELSHLYKRHTIKEMQYQLITSAAGFDLGKKLMSRSVPATSKSPMDFLKGALDSVTAAKDLLAFLRTTQIRFQQNQEFEADACAVEWMKRSNENPSDLWVAFGEMQKDPSPDNEAYVATHPSYDDRRKNIELATGIKTGGKAVAATSTGGKPKASGKAAKSP